MIRRVLSHLLVWSLLAGVATLAWLGGTEPGARVMIAYVSGLTPGFSMRHAEGTLAGPLTLRKVVVKSPKARIDIDRLRLDWAPSCLFIGEICLREAQAGTVTVTLPVVPPPVAGAPRRRLPAVNAPLPMDIGQLRIDTLDVVRGERSTRYTALAAALAWQGDTLRVDRLVVGMPSWEATGTGTLVTQGDWPVDALLAFNTPRTGTPVFSMRGTGKGSLFDAELALVTDGLVQAELTGRLQPLEPGLPFSATARAAHFQVPPRGLPEKSAQLQDIVLSGHGLLLGEFVIEGSAGVDTPWTPRLPARLVNAHGTWRGLDRAELRIEDPRLRATVASDYGWLGGQRFRATVRVEHLDLSLVHPAAPSRLAGTLQVDGRVDREGTAFDIGIDTLDGRFRQWPLAAQGPLRWREGHWLFDALQLRIGDNRATITGALGDTWDARAALALSDLQVLVPALAGRADGSATIGGAPTDPRFTLALATQKMLLPAVPLPAPVSRRVRLPAADWTVNGVASLGDFRIDDARTLPGQPFAMAASGTLAWRGPLQWDLDTDIARLSLADLLPELAGDVQGRFASRGSLAAELQALQVQTALQGDSLGQPLTARGTLDWSPGRLHVDDAALRHGDNRVTLTLRRDDGAPDNDTDDRLDIDADVQAPALAASLLDLAGAATLRLRVSGPSQAPDVNGSGTLEGFRWRDLALGRLVMEAGVDEGFRRPSTFSASVDALQYGGRPLQSASLSVQGTRAAHALEVDARSDPVSLRIAARGRLDGERRETLAWQGQLDDGAVDIDGWRWETRASPAIAWSGQQVDIAPHCWSDGQARACLAEPASLGAHGRFAAEIFHLPVESLLGDLLPIDTRIEGRIGGTLSASWEDAGLATLAADVRNEGALRLAQVDEAASRALGAIDTLRIDARLDDRQGSLTGTLHGEGGSEVQATATLGPGSPADFATRALAARVTAKEVPLSLLEAFTYQLRDTGGHIAGSVGIAGTPAQPRVAGRVDLVDGRTGFTRLPVNLVDINIGSRFDGSQATFNGSLRTAESPGSAKIGGQLLFGEGNWRANASLSGNGLVFAAPPEYHFTTAPDLRVAADSRQVEVTGTVQVPAGRLEIKALPAQSVRRSRDVIVVNATREAGAGGLDLRQRVDVNFVLGDDVNFRAFGGEGRLGGDLRVRSSPELPLLVNGELHVFDGKYTSFGQALTLKQADIIFNGPADQPLIDALAVRNFDDAAVREVGLRLTGSLRAPQTTLWSSPTMPDEEALSWLATGRPLSEGPINLRGEAAQAALSLGVAQGSALLTAAGQEIGLQDVQLATTGEGDDAEVQVGTNVNEKLFVGYNRRVFTGDESVLLRLHLTRRLVLEALSGIESALDIFYTFEF